MKTTSKTKQNKAINKTLKQNKTKTQVQLIFSYKDKYEPRFFFLNNYQTQ